MGLLESLKGLVAVVVSALATIITMAIQMALSSITNNCPAA
jgi:hypothetical protein